MARNKQSTTARTYFLVAILTTLSACGPDAPDSESQPPEASEPATPSPVIEYAPASPEIEDLLPDDVLNIWHPWEGDLDGMVERRVIRALTSYGGYQFYYEGGRPRGAVHDMLRQLELHLNETLNRRNIRVYVLPIPVARDQLIPSLLAGHGDIIASDLTTTVERSAVVDFSRPILSDINEVIVAGPDSAPLDDIHSLSGREVFVRPSSSYHEHLSVAAQLFEQSDLQAPTLVAADELLEAEDIVEMLSRGQIDLTVMDDYKAEFWKTVFPDIRIRNDLVIASEGSIAWAYRKNSPELAAMIDTFLRKYGKGSLFGNDTYARYLKSATRARCTNSRVVSENLRSLIEYFQQFGETYSFDWMRLAAQAYQESGLRQDRSNPSGAVGIMQIKPSTAADRHIGIDDVSTVENNIHAGTKYMRFLADRYFSGDEFDELNQWLFSLAAYNAGPAKINRYRREAASKGYNSALWFDNVEIVAAQRIGRETVGYVSSIFKYFVGYQLTLGRLDARDDRFGEHLTACQNPEA